MIRKRRVFVLLVILICVCILSELYQHITNSYVSKCDKAAETLFEFFADIHFDGVVYDDTNNEVSIYEYIEACDSSSVLKRKIVKVVELDSDAIEALSHFKNVKKYCDGIFFASSIGWDGEWNGIYINYSALPSSLKNYVRYNLEFGHYWIDSVPDHIWGR